MAKTKASETANKEASTGMKTFKSSSEIESLYRFIHDNGLRAEARSLIEFALKKVAPAKKKRGRKKAAATLH